jgi:photosystem II stability/assembly factor-like uncharacterized protein
MVPEFNSASVPFSGAARIDFVDELHGWINLARASSSNFSMGILLATEDGGVTWNQTQGDPGVSGSVQFVTPTRGWLVGGPGNRSAYFTTDAANSWKQVVLKPPSQLRFAGPPSYEHAVVVDENKAYLIVRYAGQRQSSSMFVVFLSRDGGRTWGPIRTFPASSNSIAVGLASKASGSLIVVESSQDGRLATNVVDESGRGNVVDAPDLGARDSAITAVSFATESHGWALSAGGHCDGFKTHCSQYSRLLSSRDGGATWTDVTPASVRAFQMRGLSGGGSNNNPNQKDQVGSGYGRALDINQVSMNIGFDQCNIASPDVMQSWWNNSPYADTFIYIGGVSRTCSNSGLDSDWVTAISNQGWGLIPTWVGPQSECACNGKRCRPFPHLISRNPATAQMQGQKAAAAAMNAAASLGLSGSIVYYDMEPYTLQTTCSRSVNAFVTGWVNQMHSSGSPAGMYGTPQAAANDFVDGGNILPDDVWITSPTGIDSLWNLGKLPNDLWANDQRIHQYTNSHYETWGGIQLGIDNDIEDATISGGSGKNDSVTLNLSSQNMVFVGLGPDQYGDGQVQVTLGSCVYAGGTTTCTLSGTFDGFDNPSGTYTFTTTYPGNGPSPITGIATEPGGSFYNFDMSQVQWEVTLSDSSGTELNFSAPGFTLYFDSSATCTGVPSCSAGLVGLTLDATMTGPISDSIIEF